VKGRAIFSGTNIERYYTRISTVLVYNIQEIGGVAHSFIYQDKLIYDIRKVLRVLDC
jgi:hypothetical protein